MCVWVHREVAHSTTHGIDAIKYTVIDKMAKGQNSCSSGA